MKNIFYFIFAGLIISCNNDKNINTRNESINLVDSDTDGDGLPDAAEVSQYNTDPNLLDTDGDGLNDSDEITNLMTDALNPDSDGDGYTDGEEVFNFTNPNDPGDPAPEIDDGGIIPENQNLKTAFEEENIKENADMIDGKIMGKFYDEEYSGSYTVFERDNKIFIKIIYEDDGRTMETEMKKSKINEGLKLEFIYGGFNGQYYILTKTNKLELFNKENEKLKELKQQM